MHINIHFNLCPSISLTCPSVLLLIVGIQRHTRTDDLLPLESYSPADQELPGEAAAQTQHRTKAKTAGKNELPQEARGGGGIEQTSGDPDKGPLLLWSCVCFSRPVEDNQNVRADLRGHQG